MKTKFTLLILLCMCIAIQIDAQDKNKMMQALMGKKVDPSILPDVYQFEWEFKTILKSGKDAIDMNYLINPEGDSFGMQMSSKEYKQMDFMCIVMDPKKELMATFMSSAGQNMMMLNTTKNKETNKENDPKYSYKEIGTKQILGYECYGIELENADFIGTLYFTLEAPVSFSALFAFGKNQGTPKGFDPALLEVLKEDALLMEMDFSNKKKKKESFTMTAVSLEKKETKIKPSNYQVMGF